MRIPLLRQKPDIEAEIFAEAQALVDDGLDVDFVLGLYPEDAEWLRPLLDTGEAIGATYAAEEPSYYFEASLKGQFLEAARARRETASAAAAPQGAFAPYRAALASGVVVAAAAAFGILSFGYATSDESVPGDWNYAFKRAGERVEYALSRGDSRIDAQLSHTEARIYEIQRLASRGDLSPTHVQHLIGELGELRDLATGSEFNDVQRARVNGLAESTVALLGDRDDGSVDDPIATEAISRANEVVVAAGGSPVGTLPTPVATPSPTATPAEPTETPEPTVEPTETPSETPAPTRTPTPTPTRTPSPTAEPTPSASPTASETATAEPSETFAEDEEDAQPAVTETP